jgi:hypothetical protein
MRDMTNILFDEPDNGHPLGDGPLRFIEFKESLPPGWPEALGLVDKETFDIAVEGLRIAFEQLNASIGERAEHGSSAIYAALWSMLGQATIAGKLDCFFDARTRKSFEDLKRRRARSIHVTAAKTRNQALDEAIIAECKAKGKMSISLEFANRISPEVKRRLKLDPTSEFPKDSKIKARLSKIKPAHSSRVSR